MAYGRLVAQSLYFKLLYTYSFLYLLHTKSLLLAVEKSPFSIWILWRISVIIVLFQGLVSLLWRTLMLPIKADLFLRFWRLKIITLLPWILEIYSQSCEMIYKFSLALKWPRFGIEILSVSQFSSLFIIIEELFRMIYPKGHPVARQEGRVLFNPSQTCADPSRSPPMMPTTNHSTGSVWSTEPVCRSSAPYLNHNPWVLTRCSHEIAFVRIDDTWAHQNN